MKANNKIIIYDNTCPMCAAYTQAFVKAGLIDKQNRKTFQNISPELLQLIDTNKSINEIPLIDPEKKKVWYGVDAIIEVLQQKIPFAKAIGNLPPLKWVITKTYKLISLNRRIIVAPKPAKGNFDCTPSFNTKYRTALMILGLVFNSIMLFPVNRYILQHSFINASDVSLQAAHFAVVAINIVIALCLTKHKAFEYLGQVNLLAITLIGLFIPLLFF